MEEPKEKRSVAFFDGQNLYRHAKDAFGHSHPNYDPKKLHAAICADRTYRDCGVRFYTGMPGEQEAPMWNGYWAKRFLTMRRAEIFVTHRPVRYREEEIRLEDGSVTRVQTANEKGIDVRIALDVVRMAQNNQYDVAVIFSQDQDLAEIVKEVKDISRSQKRWIQVVSAFPSGPNATSRKGIDGADWFRMTEEFYNACLDPTDYRPAKFQNSTQSTGMAQTALATALEKAFTQKS